VVNFQEGCQYPYQPPLPSRRQLKNN
jgi:hypothetical protein